MFSFSFHHEEDRDYADTQGAIEKENSVFDLTVTVDSVRIAVTL